MAANFPTSLPSLTDQTDGLTYPKDTDINELNAEVAAIAAKVGIDASAVTTTHDYMLNTQLTMAVTDNSNALHDLSNAGTGGELRAGKHNDSTVSIDHIKASNPGASGAEAYVILGIDHVTEASNTYAQPYIKMLANKPNVSAVELADWEVSPQGGFDKFEFKGADIQMTGSFNDFGAVLCSPNLVHLLEYNNGNGATGSANLRTGYVGGDVTLGDGTSGEFVINIDNVKYKTLAGITASVTQTQGNGALVDDINEISTVGSTNDTVTLPNAEQGMVIRIINNGANTLQIFPASGDNLGAGVDTATTLAAGSNVTFGSYDATNWETF